MQTTANYNLKKPDQTDTVNIMDLNNNADIIDTQMKTNANNIATNTANISTNTTNITNHIADYVRNPGYAVTTGSANTYIATLTPAPTSYADGMGIIIKINVASTGASTLNVNNLGAKAILDTLGNPLTATNNLKLNQPYTLRYNGTSFILQGKGGGGNATASQLLLNATATVDSGPITGTLDLTNLVTGNIKSGVTINGVAGKTSVVETSDATASAGYILSGYNAYINGVKVSGSMPNNPTSPTDGRALDNTTQTPGTATFNVPPGRYGIGFNVVGDANLVAANILSGKTIFGVNGTANIKYASGSYTSPAGTTTLTVTGLPFKPIFVMYNGNTCGMWIRDYVNNVNLNFAQSGSGFAWGVWLQDITMNSNGFTGSVYNSDNTTHGLTWWAWGTI